MEEEILKKLNEEQQLAVKSTEGYVRVIAGAGSGKTRALTHRFVYLVQVIGVNIDRILSVTFTNKASFEMKKRIRALIGNFDTKYINTFHGFCNIFLKEEIYKIDYPSNFQIIDESEQKSILKEIYEEFNLTIKDFTYDKILILIETFKLKNQNYVSLLLEPDLKSLNTLINNARKTENKEDKIIYTFLYKQRKLYNLDFNDLIFFTLFILKNNDDILKKWQEKLEYIQIDEFQDVSSVQYELVSLLSQKHKNLFIVGDPDQNIYSWRDAKIEYILNFDKNFPNSKTIYLNKNYRSRPEILMATNNLIKKNTFRLDKKLIPQKESSSNKPIYYHGLDSKDECGWIAKNIKNLLKNNVKGENIAILYRANYISRPIEEMLVKENILYIMYRGVDFYSRQEIKDCIAYLRMLVKDDDLAFLRIINSPARNIGRKRIDFLKVYGEQNSCSLFQALKNCLENSLFRNTGAGYFVEIIEKFRKFINVAKISMILDEILKESSYEEQLIKAEEQEKLENIKELKSSIETYEDSLNENINLEEYLNQLVLFTDKETKNVEGRVKLMTIHSSKGLEFQHVFVCGLNEGVFPSLRVKTIREMEEERRLAYVAFTRAEECLYLSESEGKTFDGNFKYPSRFLFDIDKIYIKYEVEVDTEVFKSLRQHNDLSNKLLETSGKFLKIGDRVKHKCFGDGSIVSINQDSEFYTILFDSNTNEKNIKIGFVEEVL